MKFVKKLYSLFVLSFLVIALFAFFNVSTAYAQETDPAAPSEGVGDILALVVNLVALVAVSGALGERGTEFIKLIFRKISQLPFLHWLAVQGYGSVLLSFLVAVFMVFYPALHLDFFGEFDIFKDLNPDLVGAFNVLVLWVVKHYIHQAGLFKDLYEAPKVSELENIQVLGLK